MKNILITLSFLLFSLSLQAGGGWPQPKGSGYIKISEWWIIANQHYTDAGKIDPNLTNGIFSSTFYGEYGLSNRLTAIVYFPFYSRAYYNNEVSGTTGELLTSGEAINGLGDADISLKYGLTKGNGITVSATLTLGLPLGIDDGGSQGNLQTGDGEFNQLIQIDAGTGFKLGNLNAYANAYVGFNNRTNGFSDEIRYGVETGVQLFDNRLTLIARLIATKSLRNGLPTGLLNNATIFANNAEFISFSPEIAWNFTENWGVAAGFATAFSGKLVYANPSYSVGVFYKW
jgi:hypothetical protein